MTGNLGAALPLSSGIFTKDPIAGVTPTEDFFRPPAQSGAQQFPLPLDTTPVQRTIPAFSLPTGSALAPIETPLVFSGFQSATLQQFAPQIQSYGFVAAHRGTCAHPPEDAHLDHGD